MDLCLPPFALTADQPFRNILDLAQPKMFLMIAFA
jgi:hypothetical protein